jgi:hypothetical protein
MPVKYSAILSDETQSFEIVKGKYDKSTNINL